MTAVQKKLTGVLAGTAAVYAVLAGAPVAAAAGPVPQEPQAPAAAKLVITNVHAVDAAEDETGVDGTEIFFTLNNGPDPNANACEGLNDGDRCNTRIPLTAGDTVRMYEDDPIGDDLIDTRKITRAGNDWRFENDTSYHLVDIAPA